MTVTLDPLIQQKLTAFARRRRRLIVIKGVLAALAMLLLTMLAVAAVDMQWMLPDWLRWSLSGAAYLAVLVVAWRACLRQLLHAPDERQLARLVEHAEPGLREDLLSAVELGRTDGKVFDSEQFRALLQADVARRMGDVEMKALLPVALIRRYIGYAVAIVCVAVGMMFASGWRFHTLLLRALFPGANLERVSRTKVILHEPEGGDRIVPQGDTVRVVVELAGEPASRARIETMGDTGGWQVMNMEAIGNHRFAATVQVSRASVRYRVKAGDALTRKYLLDARERPFVTEYQKTFHYPAYSELPDRMVKEKEGALIALEGTEVELKLKTNQPAKTAELLLEQGKGSSTVVLTTGADGWLSGKITMSASGSYRVHLVGAETGFENKFSPENELRAEPDLLPSVELESPKHDLILPVNELVEITGTASDDLGLAKVARLVRINDKGWKETLLATKPGKQMRIADRWDLFQSGVKTGDLLTMKLVATDLKGSKAESRPLQVTITASGFEMRRLEGLEALRSLNESIRALDEQAAKLVSSVRKANDGMNGADKDASAKQAAMAITGALTEFDAKFTESWTTLGGALREGKTAHAAAELVTLGRTLARIGYGSAKIAHSDVTAFPASRKFMAAAVEACAEIGHRAKAATALAEAITLSEESAILAENSLILHREQKRLMEMANAAGDDAAQWAAVAGRLRVAVSQAKVVEEILAPMTVRPTGRGKDRAKTFALQLQKHREGLAKNISPEDKPDKRMMSKLADFNRGIEGAARGFSDWSREFGNQPAAMMRDASNNVGPTYANVGRLADALDAIRKETALSPESQSAIANGRWKMTGELFKTTGDLEEIRRHADNQFVSDARQTVAAIEALSAIAAGTDATQVREKLDALDSVFRVLESGHTLQEVMDGFMQLASSERWEVRDLSAKTDAPRDWRWLEARMRLIPDELGKAREPFQRRAATPDGAAQLETAKAFEGAQQILWKAQQLEGWRALEREMGGRGNFDFTQTTARQYAEELAGQVKLALDLLRKPMAEARKELAKLSPTVSQLASALAKEQAEVKKETEKRAKNEQPKNPDDAKADAEKQIAQQQQLNAKVETLKDLVRAEANKQDILQKDQREKMRDADDALAMLKDPPPKAERALQDAAGAAPVQQKADLERAAEQQQKLADALNQIAEHFEKMEQGKPLGDSRMALREMEKELGIKEELDQQQAHAQMLAEMTQKAPEQLLKELEAKLPENPAMQKELSSISKDALADAEQKLADARGREDNVAKQLETQAKLEQGGMEKAQQGAAEAAKQAQQAAEAAKHAAQNAEQQAKTAQNPEAEKQAAKAGAEANKAAQNAQEAAEAAEKMAKAESPAQAADAAKQTAQKAGEAAKAAQQATDAAKQATASAQKAAQKPGEHQAQNQQANQQSNEAAQQAQKATDAAKRAQGLAQQAAELAEGMKSAAAAKVQAMTQQNAQPGEAPQAQQNNPQLANAAMQQQPVAMNAADAADGTDRAGRHEARLGNQQAGEQLQKLASTVRDTATKQVPSTQQALANAKMAAEAQAPVNETAAQLAQELKALQNAANGQPQVPANQTAQSQQAPMPGDQQAQAPQGQQPSSPEQSAAQQAAQSQAAKDAQAQAAQQSQAASSPAEQQAMARALDALDQQLNPATAQQPANAEGQEGQQGQQGKQGQQPQGQQGQQGKLQDGQQGQQGQDGQQGQKGDGKPDSKSAMAQAAQAASDSMRKSRAENSSPQPGSLLSGSQSDKSLGGAKAEGTAMNAKDLPNANGLKRGDWGKLPKKLADQLTKGSQESIPGEYRQAVETYYRVIAEKTKKKP